MQVYIGLDGGGTGSRAQVALSDGRRGSVFTAGSANVFSDPDVALTQITGLLARCVAEAHEIDAAARVDDPVVVLGLAGASESGAAARVIDALPYARITVLGDIDIALRGAFQDRDGIVVAVGTGSVLARQTAGRMQRAGGYGFLLGDEAGGAWIGREALRASLHAHDGFGQSGPTTAAIWAKFGSVAGMISFVGGARPADFAALAPMVLDRDRAGCPVAGAIMAAGAAYLLRAIRHLQAGSPDVPVAATGGLGPIWLERLRAGADLRVTDPMGTALDGALWQALHQDASRSATGTGTGTGTAAGLR